MGWHFQGVSTEDLGLEINRVTYLKYKPRYDPAPSQKLSSNPTCPIDLHMTSICGVQGSPCTVYPVQPHISPLHLPDITSHQCQTNFNLLSTQ